MSEGDENMPNELHIPGKFGGERKHGVTPIDQMPFFQLYQKRLAGDFDSDDALRKRADSRFGELVRKAEQTGVFDQIDRSTQDVLSQSASFEQAALNLSRSRRDLLENIKEQTSYRDTPELAGIAETEIDILAESFRLASRGQELDAKGASIQEQRDYSSRLADLAERKTRRGLPYNINDFLGRDLPEHEKNRPGFSYKDIKPALKTARRSEPEYQEALDGREEMLRYYSTHGVVDIGEVRSRVREVLENSDPKTVRANLRELQREVEQDARSKDVYRSEDHGLIGDMVGGVATVGDASVKIDKNDPRRMARMARIRERKLALNIRQSEIDRAFKEAEKYPETKEEWVLMVHRKLLTAEREAIKNLEKSNERAGLWQEIEDDIKEAEKRFAGDRGEKHDFLSQQFADDYPEGVYFPELLELYVSARSDLIDRYIEVHPDRSKGSLTLLGRVDEMPFEGIRIRLQELSGMTSWINIHNDEIFRDIVENASEAVIPLKERKEILADVDAGMCDWWNVGIKGYKNRDRLYNPNFAPHTPTNQRVGDIDYDRKGLFQDVVEAELSDAGLNSLSVDQTSEATSLFGSRFRVPTYFDSVLSASDMARLRSLVAKKLEMDNKGGTRASQLAWMMHSVNFSVDLWDKDRESISLAGKADVRDMIHYERKRVQDFGEKGRQPAGDEVTMGFYFALPDQSAFSDEKLRRVYHLDDVVRERVERMRLNWERAAFRLRKNAYDYGEFASDVWHSITVPVRDELTKGTINRKLSSFAISPTGDAIPGGWKMMPLERVALRAYSSYIEYGASIQGMISKEISGGNYKPEQMQESRHWQIEASKFRRLTSLSPWFNDLELQTRGKVLREILIENGLDRQKVKHVYGYTSEADLYMFDDNEKARISSIINEEEVKAKLTGQNKKYADEYMNDKIGHILLGFALGEVWPGSLDAKGLEARVVGEVSPINQRQFDRIERAIESSGILPTHYQEDFKLIADREFGFGTPEGMALTGGKRYINASELYCTGKKRR